MDDVIRDMANIVSAPAFLISVVALINGSL